MNLSTAAAAFRDTKSFCTVNGYQMAYVEMKDTADEDGDTLIFLHGNPTSSYLWRNVMAPLQGSGRRLIAPDLIGMGDSDKLTNSSDEAYRFENHADFLDKFIKDCVGVDSGDKVVLVLHDWGSALGLHWAFRHQDMVKGIAFMEGSVGDFSPPNPANAQFFELLNTPGVGEQLILQDNLFIETVLPQFILRNLTADEMSVYRAPFLNPGEDRRPTLTWPREVPLNGTPPEIVEIITNFADWMGENDLPKLLISATPGGLLPPNSTALAKARSWKNQQEVGVAGLHFIQEDSPDEIATAIDDWLNSDAFMMMIDDDAPPTSSPDNSSGGMMAGPTMAGSNFLFMFMLAAVFRKFW